MIVNDIPLTLRLSKGTPLTAQEADANFTSLKQAILLISEGFDNGRVLVSQTYPPDGEAANTLLVLVDSGGLPLGLYIYDSGDWVRIGAPTSFYCTDTGTANTYVTAITDYPTAALTAGQVFIFKASNANTGPATFKVNSLASVAIQCKGVALTSGQIAASQMCVLVYDGAAFELVNPVPPVPATPMFSQQYDSGEIIIVEATHLGKTLELPHGLKAPDGVTAAKPKLVVPVFVCVNGYAGYAVGEELPVDQVKYEWVWDGFDHTSDLLTVSANSTNIRCAFGMPGTSVIRYNSSVATHDILASTTTISNTKAEFMAEWRLRIYAYA